MNKLIFLKSFNSIILAEFARNLLKSHNINSIIKNSGVEFPGDLGDSFGGELYVLEKDYEKAKEILDIEAENQKQ